MKSQYCLLPFILTVLCVPASLCAQKLDDIKKKYPDQDYVMLKNITNYTISVSQDTPRISSQELEEFMSLNENGAMRKEGRIYHSGFHKLVDYKAYTITPGGKKIDATDFKTKSNQSAGIFYDDAKTTSFNYSTLTPGAISHLEYNIIHENPYLTSPGYLNYGAPVLNSELKITCDNNIKLKYVIKGLAKDQVRVKEEKKKNETVYTFAISDIKGEDYYPDAPSRAYWGTHVVFFIEQYKKADGSWQKFLSEPADLYKLCAGYVKDINKEAGAELKAVVDSVTRGKSTDRSKAEAIYSWVQSNIKYVAFEDGMEGFIPRDANLVCHRRFGDCKDMASILTLMLRYAGMKSYYTWIGTRSLPYTYEETPVPLVDNHMICTLALGSEFIFLDGTDPSCVFGTPADHIQGKEALVGIDKDNFKIIKVPVMPRETNVMTDSTTIRFEDKGISGEVSINLIGYYATDMRTRLLYMNGNEKDKYVKELARRGSNKFALTAFSMEADPADRDRMAIKGNFTLPDYGKNLAGNLFINMNLIRLYEHEEINYPKRKIPVKFEYKFIKRFVTTLTIPDGYEVDYLPQGKEYKQDGFGFAMHYEKQGNKVIYTQEYFNDYLMLEPEKFSNWNKVLENLFPLYKETVSLTKK